MQFSLHPNVYSTGDISGLRQMLESIWTRNLSLGEGEMYIVSGFANYNGGARFYKTFQDHIEKGGRVFAVISGSTSQRISSKQVVQALLECGVKVYVVNRKRMLHAKCYGTFTKNGQNLIVTSGNFTAPGMSQNVESALLLNEEEVSELGFNWSDYINSIITQDWLIYEPNLESYEDSNDPAWKLLYDETPSDRIPIDESDEITMLVILGHSDTARIQADRGSDQALGSQYFWLSKESFDFFPPLTIRNKRGFKSTLSALIELRYIDLDIVDESARVTFEAENNLDFRLGTGKLRYTKIANDGDLAAITRISEEKYEIRVFQQQTDNYNILQEYAINFIGHQGKRYGYIDNDEFFRLID